MIRCSIRVPIEEIVECNHLEVRLLLPAVVGSFFFILLLLLLFSSFREVSFIIATPMHLISLWLLISKNHVWCSKIPLRSFKKCQSELILIWTNFSYFLKDGNIRKCYQFSPVFITLCIVAFISWMGLEISEMDASVYISHLKIAKVLSGKIFNVFKSVCSIFHCLRWTVFLAGCLYMGVCWFWNAQLPENLNKNGYKPTAMWGQCVHNCSLSVTWLIKKKWPTITPKYKLTYKTCSIICCRFYGNSGGQTLKHLKLPVTSAMACRFIFRKVYIDQTDACLGIFSIQ